MKNSLFTLALLIILGSNALATKKIASTLGWNATDATKCFQSAIQFAADTVIIDLQAGDWNVGPNTFSDLKNKTIIFEPGVVLKAINSAFASDIYVSFFQLVRCENITIIGYGAIFQMDRAWAKAQESVAHSEWRHSISIDNCKGINIYGLKTYENGGDGIMVTGNTWYATAEKPNLYSENIVIQDVWCDRGWRQGISVSSVKHLRINNCWFTNTNGTWPMAGIDVEAETPQHILTDVVIENCRFTGNAQNGIALAFHRHDATSAPVDVTFRNCYIAENLGKEEIYAIDHLDATSKGTVRFDRCLIENSQSTAVLVRKKATNYFVSFDDCAFVNVSKSGGSNNPFRVEVPDYAIKGIRYGGVAFNNCLLTYSPNIPFLIASGSSSRSPGMGNVQINNLTVINPNENITYNTKYVGGDVAADCVFDFQKFTAAPETSLSFAASNSGLSDCAVENSVLTATRSSDNLSFPIPVTYTVSGTASQESDFGRMVGSMVIPKDATSSSDSVFSIKDDENETTESISVALNASTLYTGSSTQNLSIYNCAGLGADTIVTFENRPKTETALTGIYENINWGTSGWVTYSETAYSPANNVLKMKSNATTQQIDTLIVLSGKALKSLKIAALGNPTVQEVVLSSSGNPDRTYTDIAAAFSGYQTNWTVVSDTIIIKITCDSGATSIIFDDLSFGDIQPPSAPTNLTSSSISYYSATLSWSSSSDNSGVKCYKVYAGGELKGSSDSTSVKISGLTCGTTYSFTVKASDIIGNLSQASSPLNVTTSECDVLAPGKPAGLKASDLNPDSFTLSWQSSTDNDAVAGYDIYKDGVKYASSVSSNGQIEISNAGFEQGFTGWDNWSDNSSWAKDTTANFYSGAKSMRLLSPLSGGAGFGRPIAITGFSEGDVLVANCHARWDEGVNEGDIIDGGCTFGIEVAYGDVKKHYEVTIGGVNGDSLYTVSTPPLEAGFTKIHLYGYRWLSLAGKKVYFDDLSLTKESNTINVSGLMPSTAYSMTVIAKDISGNLSEASEALVVTTYGCLLPSGWKLAEIGASGQNSCESEDIFTIIGAGADIWDKADQFVYTYKSIDGDGVITAKVESIQNTNPWAKSGVMIRENLTVGSKYMDCIVTTENGIGFQSRAEANSACTVIASTLGIIAPYWVRLERKGDIFNAYQSADGVAWVQLGTGSTVAMSNTVFFGLAVTSHAAGVTCTSVISDVSTEGILTDISGELVSDLNSIVFVYPNPATANLTVSNVPDRASISVFSIDGKAVTTVHAVGKNTLNIDVSSWNKGIYLVKIQSDKDVVVKKVIVE